MAAARELAHPDSDPDSDPTPEPEPELGSDPDPGPDQVGQTQNDCDGILGGDSPLSAAGVAYARAAAALIARREAQISDEEGQADSQGRVGSQGLVGSAPSPSALVMTGTLRRYSEHVECLAASMASKGRVALRLQALNKLCAGKLVGLSKAKPKPNPTPDPSPNQALNELCAGKLDSLTYAQMRELHPEQYTARMDDKLNYRYPGVGGESCTPHKAPTLDSQAGSQADLICYSRA